MSHTLLITTRPVDQAVIARCVAESLPEHGWALKPGTETACGRDWALNLHLDPCGEPVQGLIQAMLGRRWLVALDFTAD